MKNEQNAPKIRFKGFTDAWEQRKFSDFTFPAGERNKDDLDLEPFAITSNQGFIAQSEAHDDFGYMKDVDRKMYIVVKPNSFAYNPARINVGSLGYYEGAENVIVSSLYEVFQTAEYVDDKFLKHWFKTKAFQDWIERLQEGSVRLYFYYDKLCECIMSMPSVEEQRKIGAYLDKIDNLITLHQRKCETLQKLKKSMLQKMFPKNGSCFPEIRFAGFTDAWELRKFSDLCSMFTDGDWIEAKNQSTEGVRLIQTGNVGVTQYLDKPNNAKWISEDTFSRLKCEEIFEGDILISRLPDPAGRACIMPNLGTKMITAVDCTIVRTLPDVNSEYLVQYLSTERYFKEINACLAGGTRQRVSRGNLAEFDIPLPNSSDEQHQIGTYFRTLDHLITLHQRKLETLKKLKKAMLQKMFI